MKRCTILVLLTVFLFMSPPVSSEITLSQQAALNLCSFPGIREGIIDLLYLSVDEFWHRGDYKSVFPVLRLITKIAPGELEAWAMGGWFLVNAVAPSLSGEEKKRVTEYAVEFMNAGINANPENSRMYWELANYYYRTGFYDRALTYLEKGEQYPHTFHLVHLKAHIYQKKGMNREAVKEWEKMREKFPEMKGVAERFLKELKEEDDDS